MAPSAQLFSPERANPLHSSWQSQLEQNALTAIDLDTILAPDSEEDDQASQPDLSMLNTSKPQSSSSRQPDLPSWTTYSNTASSGSSAGEDEILDSPPSAKKPKMGHRGVHGRKPASKPDLVDSRSALHHTPSHNTIPVDISTDTHGQSPKSPAASAKRARSSMQRSSTFIGVVIPVHRPQHSDAAKLDHPVRVKRVPEGVAASDEHRNGTDTESDSAPDPSSASGISDHPPAPAPGTNNLLSALTNTFARNRYLGEHAPCPRLPPYRSNPPVLARKTTSGSRGVWKADRPVPLRQGDVDTLLETDVGPMRVDRSCSDEARLPNATSTHVRFLLEGKMVSTGNEEAYEVNHVDRGGDGQRKEPAYTTPRPSQTSMFVERLETMFGSGHHNQGSGAKPRKTRIHINGETSSKLLSSMTSTSASGSRISRSRSPQSQVVSTRASSVEIEIDPVLLGKRMQDIGKDESEDQRKRLRTSVTHHPLEADVVDGWTNALQKLNKGKTTLDRQDMNNINNILGVIEENIKGVGAGVDLLDFIGLKDSIERLSKLPDIPFSDEHNLVDRAERIMLVWPQGLQL